jgi:hypothetical protein
MSKENDALEREFDVVTHKAGLTVPAVRRAGTIAAYEDMQRMAAILRQPRDATHEPSNIYSLVPFLRRT